MGELVNFLYGQISVGSGLKQFFRRSLFAIHDLHDFWIAAVHARAVAHFVHGVSIAVDTEKRSFRLVICRKGKPLVCLFWLRGSRLFFRCLGDDFGNGFLPHVVLNVFRPYFFNLARHHVK